MSRDLNRNENGMSSRESTRNSIHSNIQQQSSCSSDVDRINSLGRFKPFATSLDTFRNRARADVRQTCLRQEKLTSNAANNFTKKSSCEKHGLRQVHGSNERLSDKQIDNIYEPEKSKGHEANRFNGTQGVYERSSPAPETLLEFCDGRKLQSSKATRTDNDRQSRKAIATIARPELRDSKETMYKTKTDAIDQFDHRGNAQEKQYDMELESLTNKDYQTHVVGHLLAIIEKQDNEIVKRQLNHQKNAVLYDQLRALLKEKDKEIETMRLDHQKNTDQLRATVQEKDKEIEKICLDNQKNAEVIDQLRATVQEKDKEIEKVRHGPQKNAFMSDGCCAKVKEKEEEIVKMRKINERVVRERQESERRSNAITKEMAKIMKIKGQFESCVDEKANTRVAERFRGLYDKEWVNLCKWLSRTFNATQEIKIIETLSKLMKMSYRRCLRIAETQIKQFLLLQETEFIPTQDNHEELFSLRQQYAQSENMRLHVRKVVSDKIITVNTIGVFLIGDFGHYAEKRIQTFLNEFIDCCWLMVVSKPAMSLNFDVIGKQYGEISEHFTMYSTKKPIEDETKVEGTVYEVVWPCVCLKDGSAYYKKGDVIVVKRGKPY